MKVNKSLAHCDIVLPVYNGLTYCAECIESILANTRECAYTLHVMDDGSDGTTRACLDAYALDNDQVVVHRNPDNLGFVKSCNLGIGLGSGAYVVLVNSDVVVPPFWLSRMIACAQSDPRIASVNPFTNHAANINLPMPSGANFMVMDTLLGQGTPKAYPDVVTGVGFCILFKRHILERVGLFDPAYGKGYCEESDLCMRLTTAGYRTVLADNVYVYHKGGAAFADKKERYLANRKLFDRRWKHEYSRQFKGFVKEAPLDDCRKRFCMDQRWAPEPCLRETYRQMRNRLLGRDYPGAFREALRGMRRLPLSTRDRVTPEAVAKHSVPGRLRVTYVLPCLTMAGGVLSVVQLVNELVLLGVDARIVALRDYPEIYNWRFYTRPVIFSNLSQLKANFPETDVVVATHFTTAPWVADLLRSGRARKCFYFLQDYERWFFPESDQRSRDQVGKTYDLIAQKVVKSDWLKGLLKQDGYPSNKIRLGMDLLTFYPRDVEPCRNLVVLAMARPRTPRRGFATLVKALALVKKVLPQTEIVFFGDEIRTQAIPFSYTDSGVISDQNRLAEIYSRADVFIDSSDFQGFGRTGLEAMACGTAAVLTSVGGVTEYARDRDNCLLVPPKDPVSLARSVITLLTDKGLRDRLTASGLETARAYCHKREARETLDYILELLGQGRIDPGASSQTNAMSS